MKNTTILDKYMSNPHIGTVDLHMHTEYSDGNYTLDEIIHKAIENGLQVIAVTDHDGFDSKILKKKEFQDLITIINGTEISCSFTLHSGKTVNIHVISLFFDPTSEEMKKIFSINQEQRDAYLQKTLNLLEKEGFFLTLQELKNRYNRSHRIGRKHIAKIMKEKNFVSSVEEALDEYIGSMKKRRCFVSESDYIQIPSLESCIKAIKEAKGLAILCHSYFYNLDDNELRELVEGFHKCAGKIGGIEVIYKDYSKEQMEELINMSDGMFISAGGDFHGQDSWEKFIHGPIEIYEEMKKVYEEVYDLEVIL